MPPPGTAIDLIHLSRGDEHGITSAVVAPAWGANVIALAHRHVDWSWPQPVLEAVDVASVALAPSSYGMPLLAPTPGRIGRNQDGRLRYAGRDYRITPTRHGHLRGRAWRVREATADALTCECEVDLRAEGAAAQNFPWRLHAVHSVRTGGGCVHSTLTLTNTGDTRAPVNAGWHPYLHRSPGPCTVHLPARRRWRLDDAPEPTPTGELVAADAAFMHGRVLPEGEHWDHVFTMLEADAGGHATCWVEQPARLACRDGKTTTLRLRRYVRVAVTTPDEGSHPVAQMQLFTPPGRAAISLEPLSSTPNAVNLAGEGHPGTGLCELDPGASVAFSLELGLVVAE